MKGWGIPVLFNTESSPSIPQLCVNIGGVWKTPTTFADILVNINGIWKSSDQVYQNINGVWKTVVLN